MNRGPWMHVNLMLCCHFPCQAACVPCWCWFPNQIASPLLLRPILLLRVDKFLLEILRSRDFHGTPAPMIYETFGFHPPSKHNKPWLLTTRKNQSTIKTKTSKTICRDHQLEYKHYIDGCKLKMPFEKTRIVKF